MSEKNNTELYSGGLTLIGSLEPIVVGDTFSDWPLHITILPRIEGIMTSTMGKIDTAIQRQVGMLHCLELVGIGVTMLGEFKDRQACIVDSWGAVSVHNGLLDCLRPYLPTDYYANNYVGDKYSPHVTGKPSNFLNVGEAIVLDSLYLISRQCDSKGHYIKTVEQQYQFGFVQQ